MKNFLKYIGMAVAALSFASCSGNVDPEGNGTDVPEGVLRIFADKTEIVADGQDEVTFTVMFGSEDVSNAKTLQLTRSFEDGEPKYMAYGSNKFSTSTAGTYTFKAEYYYAGRQYSDNEILVTATPFYTGDAEAYAQRVLAAYFTSTNCTSCPAASAGLKRLQGEHPGKISVVSFHSDALGFDPMAIPETELFRSELGTNGFPNVFWNLRRGKYFVGPDFSESYQNECSINQPTCGVAINTNYDAATSKLDVELGIKSNLPAIHRYIVFIIEDGIQVPEQNGKYSEYDNVVRKVIGAVNGNKINNDSPLTVGEEAKVTETITFSSEWDAASMRVVVAALLTDDGRTFIVNNVNECKVGESVGYLYNE